MKKFDIAVFKNGEGAVLYGRVTSTGKRVTLKALGIGTIHRMTPEMVAKVIEPPTIKAMVARNHQQLANISRVIEKKMQLRENKRQKAIEYDLNGPGDRYDWAAGARC